MALSLFGVTFGEAHVTPPPAAVSLVAVRELSAICAESAYAQIEPNEAHTARFADVIGEFATRGPVLPAPFGVVFRGRESVERWLELHYLALTAALNFVDNRVAARVHVTRPGAPEERESGADLASVAAETLRTLRRSAVTTVPLRTEHLTGIVLSAAFLVEEERWKEFAAQVEEQGAATPGLRFELTGPWPPYDFIQMQLGS